MVRGEAEAVGMVADLRDAQRLGVGDEQPEDAPTRRAGTDGRLLLLGEPDRDEFREGLLLLVEHAERPVARAGHGPRLLDHVAQDLGQFQVRLDQQRRLEHPPQLGRILDRTERHMTESTHAPSSAVRGE